MPSTPRRGRPMAVLDDADPLQDENGWTPARPRTLVDHAVESILSAAARGLILPGDRLTEPELALHLNMSRVPIREALRILESQGVVVSAPYKGIRLMEVTPERLAHLIDVRVPLETLACRRAIEGGRNGHRQIGALRKAIADLDLMRQHDDVFGFASADTAFHRRLIGFSGNTVLTMLWESIARQLTVIFGLSTMGKPMATIVDEHRRLTAVFETGDLAAMDLELEEHIRVQALDVNYEAVVANRRDKRSGA